VTVGTTFQYEVNAVPSRAVGSTWQYTVDGIPTKATGPNFQYSVVYLEGRGSILLGNGQIAEPGSTARFVVQLDANAQGLAQRARLETFTVATLPSAANAAEVIFVSDMAGGAEFAFSDGTNWRRWSDRTIAS